MRPTVVTRRLMPGTMWGDARYPSLGYCLDRDYGRWTGANPARRSVAAELIRKLEASAARRSRDHSMLVR
jgi:hypothetical protein